MHTHLNITNIIIQTNTVTYIHKSYFTCNHIYMYILQSHNTYKLTHVHAHKYIIPIHINIHIYPHTYAHAFKHN